MAILEGKVGASQAYGQGGQEKIALGQFAQTLTGDISARFQEAVRKGNCFIAVDGTTRLLDAPSGTPVGMVVANPAGSGKNFVLWFASASHNGVALTAGGVVELAANFNPLATIVSGGTAVTVRNCLIGGAQQSTAKVAVAATAPSGTAIFSLGNLTTGAITTTVWAESLRSPIDGLLMLSQGTSVAFHSTVSQTTASTGGTINCTLIWEEVPA